MPRYLGDDVSVAYLESLVAAYAGRPLRPVGPRFTALVIRYLELRTVRTPADAQLLGFDDAVPEARAHQEGLTWT